jgi:hypothetical protein
MPIAEKAEKDRRRRLPLLAILPASLGGATADEWSTGKSSWALKLKPRKIPMRFHLAFVAFGWLSAVLSSAAFDYAISVPLSMVFRSSSLLINLIIGFLIMGRK